MELVLDVEVDGETRRVEVGLSIDDAASANMVRAYCGEDALLRLAQGEWVPEAAKAILYVNLLSVLADGEPDFADPPFKLSDIDLDWGELAEFMVGVDPEMEAGLAEASEFLEEEEE